MTNLAEPLERYSELVCRYFENPEHAGSLADEAAISVYQEEGGTGARILLTAVTDGATLHALRFQAFGCPHFIAAAELLCERFEGQAVKSTEDFDPQQVLEALRAPVEKTGRMLLLDDALKALRKRIDAT